MHKTWGEVTSLNFKIESKDTNANAIQIVSDHEVVFACGFRNNNRWRFRLFFLFVIQFHISESLLDKVVEKYLQKIAIEKSVEKKRYKKL